MHLLYGACLIFELTKAVDQERRFGGLSRLYSTEGAARIRAAHVAVVGVGGVGSWAAEALVRSGIGAITLIDFDQVAESNINRQIHALDATVGMAKVHALQQRFAQINPDCVIHAVEEFVEPASASDNNSNWPVILPAPVDAIIDACDQVRAKALLASWAAQHRLHFISVGAAGGKELAQFVEVGDLADVTHDPLLAQMRYRLRREYGFARKGRMKVCCVFSRENVKLPDAACQTEGGAVDGSLNCHGYGSVVAVTATFGMVAAGQILHDLAHGH